MLASLLAACANGPDATQRITAARAALDAAPLCCTSLAQARRLPLPLERTTVQVDPGSQALAFDGTKAFFVLYELPPFSRPYSIVATSLASGRLQDMAILAMRVATFDANFKRTRSFGENDLRDRGNGLERTIFVNPSNRSERYIAFYGSASTATIERMYSSVTTVPIATGGGIASIYTGQDGVAVSRLAPVGALQLEVQGLASPEAK